VRTDVCANRHLCSSTAHDLPAPVPTNLRPCDHRRRGQSIPTSHVSTGNSDSARTGPHAASRSLEEAKRSEKSPPGPERRSSRIGAETCQKPSSLLYSRRNGDKRGEMETNDPFSERIQRQQRLTARLRSPRHGSKKPSGADLGRRRSPSVGVIDPTDRGDHGPSAQVGSTNSWARKNPARSPGGSVAARSGGGPSKGHPNLRVRLAGEMDALRRCREWLERWSAGTGRGEPAAGVRSETESVSFDRPRVLRCSKPASSPTWTVLAGVPPIARRKPRKEASKLGASATGDDWRSRPASDATDVQEERPPFRALPNLPPSEKG